MLWKSLVLTVVMAAAGLPMLGSGSDVTEPMPELGRVVNNVKSRNIKLMTVKQEGAFIAPELRQASSHVLRRYVDAAGAPIVIGWLRDSLKTGDYVVAVSIAAGVGEVEALRTSPYILLWAFPHIRSGPPGIVADSLSPLMTAPFEVFLDAYRLGSSGLSVDELASFWELTLACRGDQYEALTAIMNRHDAADGMAWAVSAWVFAQRSKEFGLNAEVAANVVGQMRNAAATDDRVLLLYFDIVGLAGGQDEINAVLQTTPGDGYRDIWMSVLVPRLSDLQAYIEKHPDLEISRDVADLFDSIENLPG